MIEPTLKKVPTGYTVSIGTRKIGWVQRVPRASGNAQWSAWDNEIGAEQSEKLHVGRFDTRTDAVDALVKRAGVAQ